MIVDMPKKQSDLNSVTRLDDSRTEVLAPPSELKTCGFCSSGDETKIVGTKISALSFLPKFVRLELK